MELVCKIDLFSYSQQIYLRDNNTVTFLSSSTIQDLANTLINYCNLYGIDTIHLFGIKKNLEKFQEEILSQSKKIKIIFN